MTLNFFIILTLLALFYRVSYLRGRLIMMCPFCNHTEDRVLDTRIQKDGTAIKRRRECLSCKERFTTQETLMLAYPYVVKKNNEQQPFMKEKIYKGIQMACQKRPISLAQMETMVENIATWALNVGEKKISSRDVGHRVMDELRYLDGVSYVRFASVYKTFHDIDGFVESLKDKNKNEGKGKNQEQDNVNHGKDKTIEDIQLYSQKLPPFISNQ